jgi:hypothetical protein
VLLPLFSALLSKPRGTFTNSTWPQYIGRAQYSQKAVNDARLVLKVSEVLKEIGPNWEMDLETTINELSGNNSSGDNSGEGSITEDGNKSDGGFSTQADDEDMVAVYPSIETEDDVNDNAGNGNDDSETEDWIIV